MPSVEEAAWIINQVKHHINNETEQTDKILARIERKLDKLNRALTPRKRRK
jgi:hypothetical protein